MYFLGLRIKKIKWSRLGSRILSLIELGSYGICLTLLLCCTSNGFDESTLRYVTTALLAIAVMLTFTGVTITGCLKESKLSCYLSKVSLSVCLTHSIIIYLFHRYLINWDRYVLPLFAVVLLWSVVFQFIVDWIQILFHKWITFLKENMIEK